MNSSGREVVPADHNIPHDEDSQTYKPRRNNTEQYQTADNFVCLVLFACTDAVAHHDSTGIAQPHEDDKAKFFYRCIDVDGCNRLRTDVGVDAVVSGDAHGPEKFVRNSRESGSKNTLKEGELESEEGQWVGGEGSLLSVDKDEEQDQFEGPA